MRKGCGHRKNQCNHMSDNALDLGEERDKPDRRNIWDAFCVLTFPLFFFFVFLFLWFWYSFLVWLSFLLFAKQGNEGMERKEKKNIFSLLVSEAEER